MEGTVELDRERARTAPQDQIPVLVHDTREEILRGLLENPQFQEIHVCLLLGRKDLSVLLLENIASRKEWMSGYRVRRALAFHPNVPHTIGVLLVRELYLTDLVQLTCSPSGQPALRHLAEALVLARLPQLPPAQKLMLARRGSSRIMGALLTDGSAEVLPAVLDSPLLNEGHVLKILSRVALSPRIVAAIAEHGRWSHVNSVRLALLRNPQAPLARVLSFLPTLSTLDLQVLSKSTSVPSHLQSHIRHELSNRMQHGKSSSRKHS